MPRDQRRLTASQRQACERVVAKGGVLTYIGTNGLGRSAWERMMTRLCAMGLFTPYVHGGLEITEAGREVLTEKEGRREKNDGR